MDEYTRSEHMFIFTKARFFLPLLVLVVSTNCSESHEEKNNIRQNCPDRGDINFFFPATTIDSSQDAAAATDFLAQLGEPSFSCGSVPFEGYRLIDVRADDFRVIRLTNTNGDARLKYMHDAILPKSGGILSRPEVRERSLSATEWQTAKNAVSTFGFWTEPSSISELTLDGFLLIEGRRAGRHRVLSRVGIDLKINNAQALSSVIRKLADVPTR
jgi:hypothetical protein